MTKVWNVLITALCVFASLMLIVGLPKYESFYLGMGAELPTVTKFTFSYMGGISIIPALASVVLLIKEFTTGTVGVAVNKANIILAFISTIIFSISIYFSYVCVFHCEGYVV